MLGLVDSVLHAFQPERNALAPDMPSAVAGSEDRGIGGRAVLAHDDAVLARQARITGQFHVGHDADADQRQIGGIRLAAGAQCFQPAVSFESFDGGIQQ